MKSLSKIVVLCLTFAMCGGSPLHAGWEWGHHQYDMDVLIAFCIDSCTHVNDMGAAEVVGTTEDDNFVLGTSTVTANLDQGCHDQGTVTLSGQMSGTKTMSVSASDSTGGSFSFNVGAGWAIGELAKDSVSAQLGWTKTWDWTISHTTSESWTMGVGASKQWPQSGSRRVTGPGANITMNVKVFGRMRAVTMYAKTKHGCYTTIISSRYIPGWCNAMPAGSVVYSPYSGDGTV